MEKREFLKLIALASLARAARVEARDANQEGKTEGRVVVIGAGLAGLAAAGELQDQGYEVIVVEGVIVSEGAFGLAPNGTTCRWISAPPGFMVSKEIH